MSVIPFGPASPPPKQFVLCFDGTGNKFSGDESDSNVLKIFRMLDRSKATQFHYYQPGIGTYVASSGLSSQSRYQRIRSAYLKAKDTAIGSSFDEHVMGGYKFLMRYYSPGDDIYFIGFSRGSYIARFLAEMLDYVGLLAAGNEELIRFAWKTFAKWQQRRTATDEDREEKSKLFRYMKAFRETFSRPISRIKFMGLFDTVNSVPKFETAWMQRSKFPYTAQSSARVIRHAVGIDERRAKFRQDLISQEVPNVEYHRYHLHQHLHQHLRLHYKRYGECGGGNKSTEYQQQMPEGQIHETRYCISSPSQMHGLTVPDVTLPAESIRDPSSQRSATSLQDLERMAGDESQTQNIEEVWFPGGHADIGGGWKLGSGERWPLSHAPLVWMVQEAERAGLQFDQAKLKQFECCEEFNGGYTPILKDSNYRKQSDRYPHEARDDKYIAQESASSHSFRSALHISSTNGLLHDCLEYGSGIPAISVTLWRLMEHLPFRRMDLQEDGSWKPIRWPLPNGEVRDIPEDAKIHVSAIRRMKADPSYRPGNLIIGGGGRGVRKAGPEYGIGEWVVFKDEGDHVRETYIRKSASSLCKDIKSSG